MNIYSLRLVAAPGSLAESEPFSQSLSLHSPVLPAVCLSRFVSICPRKLLTWGPAACDSFFPHTCPLFVPTGEAVPHPFRLAVFSLPLYVLIPKGTHSNLASRIAGPKVWSTSRPVHFQASTTAAGWEYCSPGWPPKVITSANGVMEIFKNTYFLWHFYCVKTWVECLSSVLKLELLHFLLI